jgi:hypothetical protein
MEVNLCKFCPVFFFALRQHNRQRLALHFRVGFLAVSASKFAQVLSCKRFTRNAGRLEGCRDICRRSGTPQPLPPLFAIFYLQVTLRNMFLCESGFSIISPRSLILCYCVPTPLTLVTSTSEKSCSVLFGSTFLSFTTHQHCTLILCRRQLAIKSLNRKHVSPPSAIAEASDAQSDPSF